MLRLTVFVAILIVVRGDALERDESRKEAQDTSRGLLEEANDVQSNIESTSLNQEIKRIAKENVNLQTVDFSNDKESQDIQDEEEKENNSNDIQDDIQDEKENDSDDLQDDIEDENENDSDDVQDDIEEQKENDSDDVQDDAEDGSDATDTQEKSHEEDDSESANTQDGHGDSLSQLHDMINRANPGLFEGSKRTFEDRDMIDGDIKLDEETAAELVDFYKRNPQYLSLDDNDNATSATPPDTINKRKVTKKLFTKWRMPIRYRIKTSKKNEVLIKQAMRIWQRETCIRFKEKKKGLLLPPRLIIKGSGTRCWANVGKKTFGNTVNLGKGCQTLAIALHELGHAIGFYHEQSRPDRNKFVIIKKGNIKPDKLSNFFIKPARTYGIEYDYGSIMHYSQRAFAIKKGLKTIIAKKPNYERTMGQRIGLSFNDIKAANYHYCQKKCKKGLKWSKCRNGGYRNPNSCGRCKCPDGWTGRFCTFLSPSKPLSTSCGIRYRYATSSYQSLKSPGYPTTDYTPTAECTWRIRAPAKKRVRLIFSWSFELPCHSRCLDFVEVRHRSLSNTGPRFCCTKRPNGPIISTGRDMLVLFRTYSTASRKGFRAYYKYV